MKLWQRIYENCHLLGMPLKFCYRRRILIGPKTVVLGSTTRSVRQRFRSVDQRKLIHYGHVFGMGL